MKNRLIALLLALAMCFSLCSCGVDFDDDIDDEKDSELSELDKYVEAVYVYLLTSMCDLSDLGYEIYRIDYNHDNIDDWVICCYPSGTTRLWLLFDGGCLDASPKVFFNWGNAGELNMYISKSGNIYVENSYLVKTYGYTSCFCYNGEAQDYCLYYEYDETEEGYKVNGKSTDKSEYDDYLSDLHLSPLTGGETDFDEYLDISEDCLELVLERVCEFPFVDSCTKKDIDDDGKDDLVFSTKLSADSDSGDLVPSGINCNCYENGNEMRNGVGISDIWRNNYHVICSNSSHTTVDTVTEEKAQSLLSGEKEDDKAETGKDKDIKQVDQYVENIYVYLVISMIDHFEDYEIYRFDYNHDGIDDWIIYEPYGYGSCDRCLLFDGGCVDYYPEICINSSMQGELNIYKSGNGNFYFEDAITDYRYAGDSEYFCYNGEFQEICLSYSYEHTTEECTEDDKRTSYAVNGKSCTEAEYNEYLSKLRLTKLTGGEMSFNRYLDIPDAIFDEVIERVSEFPFVYNCSIKDVDGDGKDEFVFSAKPVDSYKAPTGLSFGVCLDGCVLDEAIWSDCSTEVPSLAWKTISCTLHSGS